jgi:hypothetical protein
MANINPVEEFLAANPTLMLSIKSLSKRLEIRKSKVVYCVHHSDHIRRVNPMEVGSLKYKICVYTNQ